MKTSIEHIIKDGKTVKIHVERSKINSFENSIEVDTSSHRSKYFNQYKMQWTKQKRWVETVEGKGMRFCHASRNDKTGKWSKTQKEKLYPFVAIARAFGAFTKIYINEHMHVSYIHQLFDKWIFDDEQIKVLERLIKERS